MNSDWHLYLFGISIIITLSSNTELYFLNKKSGLDGSRFSIFCIFQFWRPSCNIRLVYSSHQKIQYHKVSYSLQVHSSAYNILSLFCHLIHDLWPVLDWDFGFRLGFLLSLLHDQSRQADNLPFFFAQLLLTLIS